MSSSVEIKDVIRSRLIDEIEADLIGPRKGATKKERAFEITTRNPKNEYIAGVLFPGNWEVSDEDKEQESGGDTDDEDNTDSNIVSDKLFKPSSFGLTCRLAPETKEITATIEYGIYYALKNKETKITTYHRTPQTESFQILIDNNSDAVQFKNNPNFQINYTLIKENNQIILDFYVLNNAEKKEINYWFDFMFQTKIFLESVNNEKCFIQDRTGLTQEYFPASDAHLEILFKDKISFGKGHLCSLTWDKENIKNRCINKINSTFIPQETSDYIDHTTPTGLDSVVDMTALGTCTDKTKLRGMLEPLIIKYEKWAGDISSEIDSSIEYTSEEIDVIKIQIKNTDLVLERMRQGIDLLESDQKAFDSFTFANMAIAWQQVHGKWAANNAEKGEIDGSDPLEPIYKGKSPKWRLFQIAFILMNLESIANPQSKYRESVDLLWFPTGGGKTEAYLGLVAFILSYRRLKGADTDGVLTPKSFGTSVIMRYTLRLLTVQQFQRAATLMCACEKLRLDKKFTFICPDCDGKKISFKNIPCSICSAKGVVRKWGDVPFQVGLWVGASVTPNSQSEAVSAFWKLKKSGVHDLSTIKDKNPYILINCPWCGTKLKYTNGEVTGKPLQWRLFCSRDSCIFSKHLDFNEDLSLPVVLVDDDIYSRVPALIIATVDKFAQIAWNPKVKAVFGKVNTYCDYHGYYDQALGHVIEKSTHTMTKGKKPADYITNNIELLPPDMIIQDELHLISGPLGTLSGLYETAIEFLCSNNGIKPKIIASTATTRAAADQIQKLFNRDDTQIFPPQIKTFGDTFFSTVDAEQKGKTYLGILATGKSGLTVLAKVSAIILRRIRQFEEDKEYSKEDLDPYFTLVTYFNSQRELGGASMNFKDSVPDFIKQIYNNFDDSPLLPATISSGTKISVEESEKEVESKSKEEEQKITKSFETKWSKALRPYQFKELITDELTSRKKSGEIPETLRKLNDSIVKIPINENKYSDNQPVDLLMATNMLSVGVDIPRLGAMIVNGQPKNNSEYIQATGRIGRTSPGLIVTLYSYTKPRDLSYYENFKDYHSNFYKNVETVGLTPFTLRARKIGLFGIIVGMIRMAIGGNYSLSDNTDANNFNQKNPDQIKIINKIKDVIQERVKCIEPDESASTATNVTNLLNQWTRDIERYGEILRYKEPFHPKISQKKLEQNMYLLKNDPTSKRQLISTPTSLRNAEQEQNFFYDLDADEDEDNE